VASDKLCLTQGISA